MGDISCPVAHKSTAIEKFFDAICDCFAGEEVVSRDGERCVIEHVLYKQKLILLYCLGDGSVQECGLWDIKEYGAYKAPHLDW